MVSGTNFSISAPLLPLPLNTSLNYPSLILGYPHHTAHRKPSFYGLLLSVFRHLLEHEKLSPLAGTRAHVQVLFSMPQDDPSHVYHEGLKKTPKCFLFKVPRNLFTTGSPALSGFSSADRFLSSLCSRCEDLGYRKCFFKIQQGRICHEHQSKRSVSLSVVIQIKSVQIM